MAKDLKVSPRGFILCPVCGAQSITKVIPGTVLRKFPLYCKRCRQETVIDEYTAPRSNFDRGVHTQSQSQ